MLTLHSLLVVALCIATAGLATAQLFQWLKRPYLLIVSGPLPRLLAARALVWLSAALVSLVSSAILFSVLPVAVALTIFFGLEAVILDICGQRIRFQVQPMPGRAIHTRQAAPRTLA